VPSRLASRAGINGIRRAALLLTVALFAAPTLAQSVSPVTPQEILHLQDSVFEAAVDLGRLRTGDAVLLQQLRGELDHLRDELASLTDRVRKREPVSRAELTVVRDRVEDVRRRARGENTVTAAGLGPGAVALAPPSTAVPTIQVLAGTRIDVRLLNGLNSATARIDDRFEATTVADLMVDGRPVVPAGSLVRGVVTAVQPAAVTKRPGRIGVRFDYLTVRYRAYRIQATVTPGNGTIAAAGHRDVERRAGATLRLRFESPVAIAALPSP